MIRKAYAEAFNSAIIKDTDTIMAMHALNEEQQRGMLAVLANKLYGMIVNKLEDIDFKEIEQSQGDVTKFKYYKRTAESIEVLKGLARQSKDGVSEVEEIAKAFDNLEEYRLTFTRGYKLNVSFIKYLYNSILMAIIADIGFMTTVCTEFIKNPDSTVKIEITNLKKYRSKFYLVHKNLISFNESVEKGDFEKATSTLLGVKAKHFIASGSSIMATLSSIPGFQAVAFIVACVIIIKTFIPMMRELAYFFFYFRTTIANYCLLQKKLLEANVENIENRVANMDNGADKDTLKSAASKQMKIASFFNKIANFFAIKYVPAAKAAEQESNKNAKVNMPNIDDNDEAPSLF